MVGILRWDGQCSLRNIQVCILKIFGLKLSLGFVYEEVKSVCQKAKLINEKIRGLVNLSHVVADEVWIKVKETTKKWTYGCLLASPKSLFIWALDHLSHRDEIHMGLKVIEHMKRGLNPEVFISDLLKTYRIISGYFKGCLHQLCTNHGIKALYKIINDIPYEDKQDKFFYEYMIDLRDRFIALFKVNDIVDIEQDLKQMRKVLGLWVGKRKEWAKPMLDFIDRNWEGLFLYKRYPEKGIENTNNGAEIIYSLFKSHYKVMKHLETEESTQNHYEAFILRNNIRVFQRGKRRGYSPVQIEGIQTDVTDWTELIWGDDKESVIREIEISALLKEEKGGSQYGDTGSISFLNHTQEGREETGSRLEEELPLRIESGLLNSSVQQNN